MISKLKAVLDDDRGVSPVIGVILMVAITVILAAVIGTFVLGLGDSLQQAPQAQLDAEEDGGALDISHNGGDAIAVGDIRITVEGADQDEYTEGDGFSHSGDFTVGNTITITDSELGSPDSNAQVQVIHGPSESIILSTEVEF